MLKNIYDRNEIGIGIIEYTFPDSLNAQVKEFINKLDKRTWKNSGIGTSSINTKIRSSNELLISEYDKLLNEKIKKFIDICAKDYVNSFSTVVNTDVPLILLRYREGGEYKYHSDNGPDFYRTVSFLIYINSNDYEGGETDFEYLKLKVKPDVPKIIFFPSSFIYSHAALPVTKGTKYVIVGWMNDIVEEVNNGRINL
jgi:predicted 2-oxoglutarate/Fe(II)-dependent dioxygenase YbiX